MMPVNFHTHTVFCDGEDEPEKLIKTAQKLGCSGIGFTGHSYTFFDESYCMSKSGTRQYIECVTRLKKKYTGKLNVYLGVEQDYFSKEPTADYEYVIGSVHYVKKGDVYIPVDESEERLIADVNKYYSGDFYAFAADYYALTGDLYNKTKCDVIGHFDLVTKFNEGNRFFDTSDRRYREPMEQALSELIASPAVFEVNTGAMARGLRSAPYPEKPVIEKLIKAGKKIIVTSDCHKADNLLFGFEEAGRLIESLK